MEDNSYQAASCWPVKLLITKEKCIIGSKIVPRHIQLIPTNRCNKNCVWCSCSEVDRKQELKYNEIKNILYYFASLGTRAITITGGGEPTLHPNINDIFIECRKNNIEIGLVTNGLKYFRTDLQVPNALLRWIRLSIDKVNKTDLIYFVTGLNKVDIGFSYVVAEYDPETIELINTVAEEHENVTHIRYVCDILNPNIELLEQVKKITKTKKAIFQPRDQFSSGMNPCYISKLKPLIGADGWVYPCCGVQYAREDETKLLPTKFRMCYWSDFALTDYFNGSICQKCYYTQYNETLKLLTSNMKHRRFV